VRISIEYSLRDSLPLQARADVLEAYARLVTTIQIADLMARPPAERTTLVLSSWDRERVLQQIEEASGEPLSASDSLPDTLIATAQSIGLAPHELGAWIYDTPHEWQGSALASWAARNGFGNGLPEPVRHA
jgi:hypothetical protein